MTEVREKNMGVRIKGELLERVEKHMDDYDLPFTSLVKIALGQYLDAQDLMSLMRKNQLKKKTEYPYDDVKKL